jgi:hypothetical protein
MGQAVEEEADEQERIKGRFYNTSGYASYRFPGVFSYNSTERIDGIAIATATTPAIAPAPPMPIAAAATANAAIATAAAIAEPHYHSLPHEPNQTKPLPHTTLEQSISPPLHSLDSRFTRMK